MQISSSSYSAYYYRPAMADSSTQESRVSAADERKDNVKTNEVNDIKRSSTKSGQSTAQNEQTKEASSSQQELTPEEAEQVKELKQRDAEVRAHEQAHAAVGGQYAGSPTYEFQNGPDGKKYAVGGEVSIDVSEASDPKQTIQKMQIVQRAAMAPSEPSPQDYKVAAEAAQKEMQARSELNESSDSQDDSHQTTPASKLDAYEQASEPKPVNAISLFA